MNVDNGINVNYSRVGAVSNRVQTNARATNSSVGESLGTTTVNGTEKVGTQKVGVQKNAENDIEKLKKVVNSMDEFISTTDTSLHFVLHEGLDEYYVQIVDSQTDEVIKEIPSKSVMDTYQKMIESLGIIVDRKI